MLPELKFVIAPVVTFSVPTSKFDTLAFVNVPYVAVTLANVAYPPDITALPVEKLVGVS